MPVVDVNNIKISDYLHVKGVRLADPGMPQWKIKPLKEKNLQLIQEYLEQKEERRKEEEKWAAIPEWKRPLIRERERKKKELEDAQRKLEEAERREREKFESLPDWKRRVLIKRKSVSSDQDANSDTKSESSANTGSASGELTLAPPEPIDNGHTGTLDVTMETSEDSNNNIDNKPDQGLDDESTGEVSSEQD